MALGGMTPLQRGTPAIIHMKGCVFVPDEPANVSSSLNHMRTQGQAWACPTPSPVTLIHQWFGSWSSWWKNVHILRTIILICNFSCICLYCCCGICLQCSQRATQGAASVLMDSLPKDRCGRGRCVRRVKRLSEEWSVGGGH